MCIFLFFSENFSVCPHRFIYYITFNLLPNSLLSPNLVALALIVSEICRFVRTAMASDPDHE